MKNLSTNSILLLTRLIKEADYDGENDMSEALTEFTRSERGNLTDLKKKGFVSTIPDDGGFHWVIFEEPARELYAAIKG